MKPLYDRIIVEKDIEYRGEQLSSGGIILPEDQAQKTMSGTVKAVGNGLLNKSNGALIPLMVKIGDRVVFNKYSGVEVGNKDDGLVAIREEDVIAIIE
jgi:chaperonin GroES